MALLWFGALGLSGALTSAYQFVDDHEIVRLVAEVRSDGVAATAWRWLTYDSSHYRRFRPIYYLHRIGEAAAFGNQFLAWSVYTAFLGFLSGSLFYAALRRLGFSTLEALAFVFFVLVGEQSATWWRRGTSETPGTALVAAAALALAWRATTPSRTARAAFVAFAALMSLCKESFTLLVPALLFALVWAVREQGGSSWIRSARSCAAEILVLLAVTFAELLFISKLVGAANLGLAGLAGAPLDKVWAAARTLIGFGHLWCIIVPLGGLALVSGAAGFLRGALPALTLSGLVVASQAVLYARAGVSERYYLPGILGVVFLLSLSMRACRGQAPTSRWRKVISVAAGLALLPFGWERTSTTYPMAKDFGIGGRAQQRFLDRVTTPSCGRPLLVAGGLIGVYEAFWSIHFYLEQKAHRGGEYFYFVPRDQPLNDFDRSLVGLFQSIHFLRKYDAERDPKPPACVGILAGEEEGFLRHATWFRPSAYARDTADGFTVYTRAQGEHSGQSRRETGVGGQ